MIFKGIVSSIENAGTRLILPDKNNIVTIPLPSAVGIGLAVGDKVAVVFFAQNFQDGLILAKY
jgi:hypothetical protein